jgi:DNA polymerase elongation subunit (family B)
MHFLIVDLDYVVENNEVIARAYGRDELGHRQIVLIHGTRPFFLVRLDEPVPDDPRIVEVKDTGWKSLKEEPLKVIYARYPYDIAKRQKCHDCSGEGRIIINNVPTECETCHGGGQIEVGLRAKFKETWQADIVYSMVLRIYYGLNGVIEIPSINCHILEVKPSTVVIKPFINVFDIETMDSVDTEHAPEPIPCFTFYDEPTDTYHVFCYGFKKHELAMVTIRLQQHWVTNLIPKLLKYNFSNPKIIFHDFDNPKAMMGSLINFKRIINPDIIAPWNKTFDMPYIYQYMKNLGLPADSLSETNKVYRTKDETIRIEGTTEVDLMTGYASLQLQELRSKSLDFCANKEFGVGKMKRTSIKEMRLKDPVGLLAYNIVDVQISYAMMRECQLIDNMQTINKISGAGLDNQSPLRIVDSFIMTFLKPRKIAVPTNVHVKGIKKKEGGAYVHKASIGKHQNIVVLDYKGYYTSMMMACNVCASTFIIKDEIKQLLLNEMLNNNETIREEDVDAIILKYINEKYIHTPNGAIFRKDKQGVIPEILVHVKNERSRHKKLSKEATDEQTKNIEDLIQQSFKRIGNIFYGQFKNPYFRMMLKEIAEAITSACMALTLRTIDIIEHINVVDLLIKNKDSLKLSDDVFATLCKKMEGIILIVKYGDTDSIFVKLCEQLNGTEMSIIGKLLEKYINSLIPSLVKEMFNVDSNFIEIEFDEKKRMKSFVQMPKQGNSNEGAKKRYIYLAYKDDDTLDTEPHFVGVDVMRSDTSPLMVEVQTKLAKMILNDVPYSDIRNYLLDIYNNFTKQNPDLLLIKETLHVFKDDSTSPQVIGANYANKYMMKSFRSGSTVYYLYLKSVPNGYPRMETTGLKALCLNYSESVPKNFFEHIDWEKMMESVLLQPTETVLEAVGYKWNEIITGTRENKVKAVAVTMSL